MTDTERLAALLHETETPWGPSMSGDSCPGISTHGGHAARLIAAGVTRAPTPAPLDAATDGYNANGGNLTPAPPDEGPAMQRLRKRSLHATPAPLDVEGVIQRVLDDRCRCGKVSASEIAAAIAAAYAEEAES